MSRLITGEAIERADRQLAAILKIGTGNFKDRQFKIAGVRRENFERFLAHHRTTLRMYVARASEQGDEGLANLTPQQEAAVLTMMTHFFLIGVVAGKESMK